MEKVDVTIKRRKKIYTREKENWWTNEHMGKTNEHMGKNCSWENKGTEKTWSEITRTTKERNSWRKLVREILRKRVSKSDGPPLIS